MKFLLPSALVLSPSRRGGSGTGRVRSSPPRNGGTGGEDVDRERSPSSSVSLFRRKVRDREQPPALQFVASDEDSTTVHSDDAGTESLASKSTAASPPRTPSGAKQEPVWKQGREIEEEEEAPYDEMPRFSLSFLPSGRSSAAGGSSRGGTSCTLVDVHTCRSHTCLACSSRRGRRHQGPGRGRESPPRGQDGEHPEGSLGTRWVPAKTTVTPGQLRCMPPRWWEATTDGGGGGTSCGSTSASGDRGAGSGGATTAGSAAAVGDSTTFDIMRVLSAVFGFDVDDGPAPPASPASSRSLVPYDEK